MKACAAFFAVVGCGLALAAGADYMLCPGTASGGHVRPDNRYFDVIPRIVPADAETTVEVVPLFDHCRFREGYAYELTYSPVEQLAQRSGWVPDKKTPLTPANGRCPIRMLFEGEQEHVLLIEEIAPDNKRRQFADLRVYSVGEDLFKLRPFKGDFHMHSNRSDGVESPAYVAGACRRVGLDFMALTDHETYAGSIEAQKAYEGVPIDLRIYPGEEVHPTDNPVHTVSLGANAGIAELYKNDDATYRKEVEAIQATLKDLPPGVNGFQCAACLWEIGKIRERGGMAMFCHPYWFTDGRYYISGPLLSYILDTQPYDALELISGFGREDLNQHDVNALQLARYEEERAKGKRIPICGISDAHGVEDSDTFGRYYTLCLSPSLELADLIASIKGLNSVAVEAVHAELPRAYGPFRLVKYAEFLLREVLPQHDEICFEEGRLMIQYAGGEKAAVERLRLSQGQTGRLYARYWGAAK